MPSSHSALQPPAPGARRPARRTQYAMCLVLALYLVLALAFSLSIPIFEAPDEDHHFFYTQRLAQSGGLPVLDAANPGPWAQEAGQPPLYYLLGSVFIRGIAFGPTPVLNPHANLGDPLAPGNKNRFIHTTAERWPWQGAALAVHLLRFFSIGLGAGTLLFLHRLVRRLVPRSPELALTALAFTAFLPQFLFISAAVTNDTLMILLATILLERLVALLSDGRGESWGEALLLGLLLGLAALTKLSGLGLLVLAGIAYLYDGYARRRLAATGLRLAAALGAAVLVAGWWYLRNWQLYGDLTGLAEFLQIIGPRPQPLTWQALPGELQGLRISLLALFGWFNLLLPGWVYTVWDLFLALAVVGLAVQSSRAVWRRFRYRPSDRPRHYPVWLLIVWLAIILLLLLRWTALTPASQGRLLFPAVAALASLAVAGWQSWLPEPWLAGQSLREQGVRRVWLALPPLALLGLSLFSLFGVIRPAYRVPPLIAGEAIPDQARLAGSAAYGAPLLFDDRIQLIGVAVSPTTVRPGERIDLILYWQALAPIPYDASVAIHLLGRDYASMSQIDSYPGWGSLPTSHWPVGPVIVDRYHLNAPTQADPPLLLTLAVGLYDYATRTPYPARRADGAPTGVGVAKVRLLPLGSAHDQPAPAAYERLDIRFGGVDERATGGATGGLIALAGWQLTTATVRPGESLTLDLYWRGLAPVEEDLQVFVHLWDSQGQRVAGSDAPPLGGWWPTSAWEPGHWLHDAHTLAIPADLPPGRYTLAVGLYRLDTLERLPAYGPPDQIWSAAALLTPVDVTP